MRRVPRFAFVLTALVGALIVLSAVAAIVTASTAQSGDRPSIGLIQAAGGTLTGIVKDKDNRSVNGAQVILSQGSQEVATTTTGSSGYFDFLEAAGTYNLTINYTGYEIYTKTVTLVDGQTLDLGYVMLTPVPNYFWVMMDIIMVVGAVAIFLVVGKRVRKL
ncbi:MAG: carboxypeptidase-like regulatory domain-containing protein [Methanomassiliicoccales archaeon]|nr:carboxypeptidase-like regulatory domain-containing protein [Methanomassiliicoccales archaeon]